MKMMLNRNFADNHERSLPRTKFHMPYCHDTVIDTDYLYPLHKQLCLPGDEISCSTRIYARLNTPEVPLMHNIILHSYYFKVPIRLVWENFRKFFGERIDVDDSIDYETPIMDTSSVGFQTDSIFDYLGAPTVIGGSANQLNTEFHAWWTRAYSLIWNTWFRNQFWQDAEVVDMDDGPDDMVDYGLLKINNAPDYFTSLLPDTQMGDIVMLPLGETAPVIAELDVTGNPLAMRFTDGTQGFGMQQTGTGAVVANTDIGVGTNIGDVDGTPTDPTTGNAAIGFRSSNSGVVADLSEATSANINDLREAFQMQALYELRQRTGNQYRDIILAEYGVRSDDASLQYPEYLGGSKQYVNIHQVIQQGVEISGSDPAGTESAYLDVYEKNGYHTYCTEPSLIIGVFAITAEQKYQEMLQRIDSFRTRDEIPTPLLMNLGEQPVYGKELCHRDTGRDDVIGYAVRWSEWRNNFSMITGVMRSQAGGTYDIWHAARDLNGDTSIENLLPSNVPDRIFIEDTAARAKISAEFDVYNTRVMTVTSIPAHLGNL